MTKHQDVSALALTGQAQPVLTLKERFEIVMTAYAAQATTAFKTPHNLECRDLERVRRIPSTGNAMQVAVDALNAAGWPTARNVGGLADALELERGPDHDPMHEVFCACNGGTVYGETILFRFRRKAPTS